MQNSDVQVSIIIVTYNSLPALKTSLQSIQKTSNIGFAEIILVDNNSTDDSIPVAQSIFPSARYIKNNYNAGFAQACNQGAKAATGKILLFYNPDLEIDADALQQMKIFFEKKSDIGALSGRMRNKDNSFQATCRNFPDKLNIFFSRGSLFSKLFSSKKTYTLPDFSQPTEVDAVAGTFMAVSKEIFTSIGYFDERFFMYMEDTDLCFRLHQAGYKNYFLPQVGGVHLWGKGSSSGRIKRSYYHHLSVWKYFSKHFPGLYTIFILPFLLLGNFLVSILVPKP